MEDGDPQLIGFYQPAPATCQKYDPRAPEVAWRVAALIRQHLPSVLVEHVGSTAVPGCDGKGIIDLMVLYPEDQLEAVKTVLDTLGFQRQTTRNPFPEDRPMRKGSVEHLGYVYRLHAHVLSAASREAAELRLFRDRLRSDADLRARYVARKNAILASGVADPVDYSEMKGEFVQEVIRGAPARAAGTREA